MSSTYQLIGILGGTFDPVHNGHLAIAYSLINQLSCEQIQFIPCRHPPHRQEPTTTPLHRLTMLQLATKHLPQFYINEIELRREGPSYMVDTLTELNQELPHAALGLIVGVDVLTKFNTWHRWQSILQLAHLIVVNRPDYELPHEHWLQSLLQQHRCDQHEQLISQKNGYIYFHDMPPNFTSASNIRRLLQEGEDITNEVPSNVAAYISQNHLYSFK